MLLDNLVLNEENFILYAVKIYSNPGCITKKEFHSDLDKIKYIKRLFRRYQRKGDISALRIRLVLNHIITIFNVFGIEGANKILFYKLEPELWPLLKTFLVFLNYLPQNIRGVKVKDIRTDVIKMDKKIIEELRSI